MSRNEGMNGAGRYGSVPSSDAGAALQYSDDDDVRDGSTGVGKANSHHHPQHHGYELNRHMSLFDLVSVGVGATVGSGVFVLTGTCVYIFFRQLTVFFILRSCPVPSQAHNFVHRISPYLPTGLIARTLSGPAVSLSWLIAGLAACASGLCYAELGGRFPSVGSTYVYAKETMGDCAAVIAGACLTLEYTGR
jgi:hypothetical protein